MPVYTNISAKEELRDIEIQLRDWERNNQYTETNLQETKKQLKDLVFNRNEISANDSESSNNQFSSKWNKLKGETDKAIARAKRMATNAIPSLVTPPKNPNETKRNNLLARADYLLSKLKERQHQNISSLDSIKATLSEEGAINLKAFMRYLTLFLREFGEDDAEQGVEKSLAALRNNFSLLSDEDLVKIYQNMCSNEMTALTKAFFTQHYIMRNEQVIKNSNNKAYNDALSIWTMNQLWMINEIFDRRSLLDTEKPSENSPEEQAKKEFMTAGSKFYKLLVGIFEYIQTVLEQKGLIADYALKYDYQMDKNKVLAPHEIHFRVEKVDNEVDIHTNQLLYQTNLSNGIHPIMPTDILGSQFKNFRIDKFLHALRDVKENEERVLRHDKLVGGDALHKGNGHMAPSLADLHKSSFATKMNPFKKIICSITSQRGHTVPLRHSAVTFANDIWPVDRNKQPKEIRISATIRNLVSDAIRDVITKIRREYLSKEQPKNLIHDTKFDLYYFGKMVQSLGCFFNPNRFCDILYSVELQDIKKDVETSDKNNATKLQSLYKSLQGNDLNNLVLLLKIIKESDFKKRTEIYSWLSVSVGSVIDEKFQVLAEKLYDSSNVLMQSVGQKLEINKEYAYDNLELDPSRVFTIKNATCLKRLLALYCGASPEKNFSYSLLDRFYNFIFPGEKLYECNPKIVPPAPANTPASSPANSPERKSRENLLDELDDEKLPPKTFVLEEPPSAKEVLDRFSCPSSPFSPGFKPFPGFS